MKQYIIPPRILSQPAVPSLVRRAIALPPQKRKRWSVKHKIALVVAVATGAVTRDAACQHYEISVEEFASWQSLADRYGADGLRATRMQVYREQEFAAQRDARETALAERDTPAARDEAA